jgi:hypothetical protein
METCVNCGFESNDRSRFTGDDPVLCIPCHLALSEETSYIPMPGINLIDKLESEGKVRSWGGMLIWNLDSYLQFNKG